jgi:Phosphoserine phosphatase RsbU, N-terminal domain
VAFRAAYASALADYVDDLSEGSLRIAYELGREAVSRRLSVLDLAVVHQEALVSVLARASGSTATQRVTRAAGDFFLEGLSSFEMVQRGFRDAQEAARLERRKTEMSRQLSTFLADASLAVDASDSLEEILRLVAEQARELAEAECCVATVSAAGGPRTAEAASYAHADRRWVGFVRWLDLFAIYRVIRLAGGSVRMADAELTALAPFRTTAGDRPLKGWLAASLTALDGSDLGAIQLFDKHDGSFTENDEAVLVHLAQMASAAVERARLYQSGLS